MATDIHTALSHGHLQASRYLTLVGWVFGGSIALIGLLNWRVDPLQFYRKSAYAAELVNPARYKYPGMARNYAYDTVVIGTSVSLGFQPREMRERLGWDALNLAMDGATAYEQGLLFDVVARTGRARQVVWDLNYAFIRGRTDRVSETGGPFPFYLYDNNPLSKLSQYLLNVDVTKKSVRALVRQIRAGGKKIEFPAPEDLMKRYETRGTGRDKVLSGWKRTLSNGWPPAKVPGELSAKCAIANFQANILPSIRNNPGVTFHLYFPPYSYVYYALLLGAAPAGFEDMFVWRKTVFEGVRDLKNVRLHDFEGVPEIFLELDHYYDPIHYVPKIYGQMSEAFGSGQYLASEDRLRAAEAAIRKEAVRALEEP
jgi:hypothetical protein